MPRFPKLAPKDVEQRLEAIPGWVVEKEALERWYIFADFNQAFAFLTRVALAQEKLDHHAELWNVYNRVKIRVNTHEVGGLTELDFRLARLIEGYAKGQAKDSAPTTD